jgi:hypothetical protein
LIFLAIRRALPKFRPSSELTYSEVEAILRSYHFEDSSISINGEVQELEKCEYDSYNFQENYVVSSKVNEDCSLERIAFDYAV